MADATPPERDIDELILTVLDGRHTPEQLARLNTLLAQDPAVAARLVDLSELQAMTLWLYGGNEAKLHPEDGTRPRQDETDDLLIEIIEQAIENRRLTELAEQAQRQLKAQQAQSRLAEELDPSEDQPLGGKRLLIVPKPVFWGGIAAAVLVAIGLLTMVVRPDAPTGLDPQASIPPPPPTHTSPASVARVLASADAVWSQDEQRPAADGSLLSGKYHLVSGAAELELSRGATVVVQSPCVFELISDNYARLELGSVVARVPQVATGFTVEIGQVRVVDLGTEFGVNVDAAGTVTTAVFEGEVVLRSQASDTKSVPMKAGQVSVGQTSGRWGEVQALSEPVARSLFARNLRDAQTPTPRYAKAVLQDEPLLYWRFEDTDGQRIHNAAGDTRFDGLSEGKTQSDTGIVGRGVRFTGSMKELGTIISFGQLFNGQDVQAYTLEMWVLADKYQHACIASLFQLVNDQRNRNKQMAAIEILGNNAWLPGQPATQNALRFLHRSPATDNIRDGQNLWPDTVYTTNRWTLLTAVKDTDQIRLYLDGRLVLEADDSQNVVGPVKLSIGNAGVGADQSVMSVRPFTGVIDEVALYPHALTDEQILNHYHIATEPAP